MDGFKIPGVDPAAMEPGLRDREYVDPYAPPQQVQRAAMEPGLRDREYVMLAWKIDEGAEAAM